MSSATIAFHRRSAASSAGSARAGAGPAPRCAHAARVIATTRKIFTGPRYRVCRAMMQPSSMRTTALLLLLSACTDTRTVFPSPRAFTKPAEPYLSVQECNDAKSRGEYPAAASCTDDLGLCPDRVTTLATRDQVLTGTYRLDGETLLATIGSIELTGEIDPNGTFVSNSVYGVVANTVWNPSSPELLPSLPGCD
jgi:hypothetical protein